MTATLYPRRFDRLDPRLRWVLRAILPPLLPLAAGYMSFVLFALLAGLNPLDATFAFAGKAFLALDPIVICIGGWTLFAYLYFVTVPPAHAIDRDDHSLVQGYYAFKALLTGFILSILPTHIPLFTRIIARADLSENPARQFRRECTPPLRATRRWVPGFSPPIVYE